jgi:hypothetical protein
MGIGSNQNGLRREEENQERKQQLLMIAQILEPNVRIRSGIRKLPSILSG